MARRAVTGSNGVFGLGGAQDTDVHVPQGVTGWTVYVDDDKLAAARAAATAAGVSNVNWFAWFTVNDQNGNAVRQQQYTVTFNAPTDGGSHTFYAYDGSTVRQVTPAQGQNKGNRARLQVSFSSGDPGVGLT